MSALDFEDADVVTASGLYLPTPDLLDEFASSALSDSEVQRESGLWIPHAEEPKELPERVYPDARGTAISLFSGCGGFDIGTTMAGFQTRVFIEFDKYAVSTLKHNAKMMGWDKHAAILDCAIENLTVEQVLIAARLNRGECDLLTGGFPCQPFSTASSTRKGTKDSRGHLFYECVRMIDGIQPKFFVLENVPGILTSSGGKDIAIICNEFAGLGYDFALAKLNAVNYGVPQNRQRIFFFGCRPDLGHNAVEGLRGMVEGATHYDPVTEQPTFQPIWLWDGKKLVPQNEPKPGQCKTVQHLDEEDEEESAELSFSFGAA